MKLTKTQRTLYNTAKKNGFLSLEDLDKTYANSDPERIELINILEDEDIKIGNYSLDEGKKFHKEKVKKLSKSKNDENEDDYEDITDFLDDDFDEQTDENEDDLDSQEDEQENIDNLDDSTFYSDDDFEAEMAVNESFDDLIHSQSCQSNVKIVVSDPVRMYLKEIGRIDLLTPEKEKEIAKVIYDTQKELEEFKEKLETGYVPTNEEKEYIERRELEGEQAKKTLTEANLRLVVNIAKHFSNPDMEFADLIQEGSIGLSKAVIKFDYTRGNKFSTYATGWIKQAITRAIADQARTIRIPVHMNETINKLNKKERELTHELGRKPTYEELADVMGITVDKLMMIKRISQKTKNLEDPVGEEDDSSYGDFVPDSENPNPEDYTANEALKKELNTLLSNLSDREERVIKLRFGLIDGRTKTLEEVGKEFGVTRERIRQIEAKALRKLRHPSRSNKLRDFTR